MAEPRLVEVEPLVRVERALAYLVPDALGRVGAGMLVRVPLGRQTQLGIVTREGTEQAVPPGKLRAVIEALYAEPVLTGELLQLAQWLRRYYAATAGQTYETMIPAAVRAKTRQKQRRFIAAAKDVPESDIEKLEARAPRQAQLYRFLREQLQPLPRGTLLKRMGISPSVCDGLIEKGLLVETHEREEREAYADELAETDADAVAEKPFELTGEQADAVADISASLGARAFRVHLLHGVTGSGKTEVYLRAIHEVIAGGGSVIFLVPEVALTPQTVGRLRRRFAGTGTKTVVWHSHLSAGERFDGWFALARGEARIVVGARSAVFAPVRNLRLIVVDEEHEPAFKQEEAPRYHGRDVAVYRAMLNGATCVLGSATPSLESLYNVRVKGYRLNRIARRVDERQLPTLHIVDLKPEVLKAKGPATLSQLLVDKMRDRHEAGEQTILFINRRGYSRRLLCPDCGYLAECPHCAVSLTLHRTDNRLHCHICGYRARAPETCPQCGSEKVKWRGYGTQRVEDVVQKLLPAAKVVRLDADTMQKKNLFRHILGEFRRGRIDVLVGTQMIAKGLDFPNVTLVGLVDADISLHMPDFRAAERTFQLLVQVAGRAGRGERAGEVIVQTFTPHAAPIQFAKRADFEGFLDDELEQREEFHYPPFRHLVRHLFRGRNPEKVSFFANKWADKLEAELKHKVEIRGPAPAPLEKAKDSYRFHLWYFVGNVSKVVPDIAALRATFPSDPDVIDVLDVDPVDLI